MTDLLSTPLTIAFIHPDGQHQPLGTGLITADGVIEVTDPLAGQEEYLHDLISELNERTYIIVKGPPAPGADRFSIGKRKIERGDPEFIAEFAAYAERIYALDLGFDAAALGPPQSGDSLLSPGPAGSAAAVGGLLPLTPPEDGPAEIDPDAPNLTLGTPEAPPVVDTPVFPDDLPDEIRGPVTEPEGPVRP